MQETLTGFVNVLSIKEVTYCYECTKEEKKEIISRAPNVDFDDEIVDGRIAITIVFANSQYKFSQGRFTVTTDNFVDS